ncbi:acetylcholinesterase-like isoform X1 [Tachypleus tridentatus]|uniref:acetylcholinesterase-like isoform X1 n=1 Tax=Tachypleus tridentatus TaxID=6853 RepID=UPI003FD35748
MILLTRTACTTSRWEMYLSFYLFAILILASLITLTLGRSIPLQGLEETPLIHTNKGLVRGKTIKTVTGKLVDVYLGISYAKPPVGKYRFRHPKPIDPWKDIFNATQKPKTCFQISDTFFGNFSGTKMWDPNTPLSEDCLKLNVWVPHQKPTKAAVLVWIFGGGYYSGTSTLNVYDAKILSTEEQMIVVSMNYRVASLGFLFFDRSDVPGNAGLFDQLMALEWVRDNIAAFGGDPNNITLFGESAGAASVGLHLLSPLSRNLFNRGILQSGSATSPWAIIDHKESEKRGLRLAEAVKCPHDPRDLDAVVNCLRNVDPMDLVMNESGSMGVIDFPFVPVVDGAFIDEHPTVSLVTKNFKKTNILMGSNSEEGTYWIIYYLTELFKKDEEVYLTREDFINSMKELNPYIGEDAQQAIIFQYTDWLNPNSSIHIRDAIDKIVGDYHFTCSVNEFAHHYAKAGNEVYMYYFIHRSSVNPWPRWMGVMHGDEIPFVFGEPLNPALRYTKEEVLLSKKMMRYWANFAKSGNPNTENAGTRDEVYWVTRTEGGKEYMTLSVQSPKINRGPRAEYCAFWQHYLPQLMNSTGLFANSSSECVSSADTNLESSRLLLATIAIPILIRLPHVN